MPANPPTNASRAWNGTHVANAAPFRYGTADGIGHIARIESTVELSEKEREIIDKKCTEYCARYAIVRPAERDPSHLDVEFRGGRPFERIRRVTGYLVGTLDRWNNAKRAEERDRVKHGMTEVLPEEEVNTHIRED